MEDEKKTPCVQMDVVVAAVEVAYVDAEEKGYPNVARPKVAAERQFPFMAKQPSQMLMP